MKSLASGASHPPAGKPSLPSVAVLPFEVMSADAEDGYLASGLAEDLVVDLTRVKGVRVAPRDEVAAYRERSVPARTLARELGVDYVLSGSVRRAGQRARISAQLVRASDGHALWAERFDRTLDDLFEVQAEVAKQIVAALQVALTPKEQALLEKVPTRSREAYELFLQARQLMESHHKEANTQAQQLLRSAIDMDPQFAQAIAALAECHARRVLAWWGSGDDAVMARELAERALAIEPDLVEAYFALAAAHRYAGDHERELPQLDRILTLDSDHQHANEYVAWSWMSRGDPAKGLPVLERITALPTARYNAWSFLSMCYDMLHRDVDAKRAEERLFEALLDELRKRPDNVHARSLLGQRLIHRGQRDAGIAQVEMCLRIAPDDNRVLYNGACTLAVAGEHGRAMELLRQAALRVPGYIRDWPRHDPDLASLRSDPAFVAEFNAMFAEVSRGS